MANLPPNARMITRPHSPGLLSLYQRGIRDGRIGHYSPPAGRRPSAANNAYYLGYAAGTLEAADEAR